MMTIPQIKNEIIRLHSEHQKIGDELDDLVFAELIEEEAEDWIIKYCEERDYQINGFPKDKKAKKSEEYDEDYFCRDRYRLYLSILSLQKTDVSELLWFYNLTFWPDFTGKKDEFINELKYQFEHNILYILYGIEQL